MTNYASSFLQLKNTEHMKTLIKLLSKTTFRNVNATAERIIAIIKGRIRGLNSYIDSLTDQVEEKNNTLTKVINRKLNPNDNHEADALRDKKTRAIYHMTNALTYSSITEEVDCAMIVSDILNNYSLDMIRKGYDQQTADTNSLLSDLDKPEVSAAIDKVPTLRTMTEELREANDNMKQVVINNSVNKLDLDNLPSASKLSPIVLDMLNNELIPVINSLSMISPDEYSETYRLIYDAVESNNQTVRLQSNRDK